MRNAFDRLLSDFTLVGLGLGIALGWSLFQVAQGVSTLISSLLIDYPHSTDLLYSVRHTEALTWVVGNRVLTFGPLLRGLVELAIVLTVALFIRSRFDREEPGDIANPS